MNHFKNYLELVRDLLSKPELIAKLEPKNQQLFQAIQNSGLSDEVDQRGWIGVDLDGTLAHYDGWKGDTHIGDPVKAMKDRVLLWHQAGYRVKIMTARAVSPTSVESIRQWLKKHDLPDLEVTNIKDFQMIELWDDRAIRIVPNTGQKCCSN